MGNHGKSKENDSCDCDDLLFLNDRGQSMHFILLMNDSSGRDELKKKVENHLGCVDISVDDMGPHSLVLTDLDNSNWKHDKVERFQIGYIEECFKRGRIYDVNRCVWEISNIYKRNIDYMNVVLNRVYTWDTIPDRKPSDIEEVESDADSNDSFLATNSDPPPRNTDKNTRHPYSRSEKEAIVKYIVDRRLYDRVKGTEMWKELERLNICPKRTWQSMKEHTIKTISKELKTFRSLTPKQRERLYNVLAKPKQK